MSIEIPGYSHTGTCDQCCRGEAEVRLVNPLDGNSAYICRECDEHFNRCISTVAEHIKAVQDRCGSRLCQVETSIASMSFGPIADVDLEFLVRDVLMSYFEAADGDAL